VNPLVVTTLNHKNFKNLEYQREKLAQFQIRVTTSIQGDLKNCFIEDCIKRGITEADLARSIFEVYYSSLREKPVLLEKEMTEVKKYLIDKIRFDK
jgi:hypothetical protein